ncbi:MAG: hypothetical protein P8N52_02990 [Crocinitomicaceae bacterium]|nr:hypothetical protein [Crocinitomicaceae bacterium]MDG1776103.1 hypothetical protein [Crocinitomicaceae bacterium]
MKIILAFIIITLFSTALFAQNDKVSSPQDVIVEIYDVVAVYREHKDGRGRTRQFTSEIKGEIIKYNQHSGVLTFKRIDGKMYSLTSSQYEYFQYDKEFTSKKKKQKVINPRKDSGLEFSVGMSAGFLNIPTGFKQDENYVGGTTTGFETPICIKGGVSKYLNKNSLVGVTSEYAMFSSEATYFNVGARYAYLYSPGKNTTFYFPVELKFSHYQAESYYYQYNDTVYTDNGYDWPMAIDAGVSINALELNVGQGLSFALKNKRSISLELMLLRQFILTEKIIVPVSVSPKTDFSVYGMKLSILMNL